MGKEIERKFLVHREAWELIKKPEGVNIRQGYLFNQGNKSCRIRLAGKKALLNIKQKIDELHRIEFEYHVPCEDGLELFEKLCDTRLEKTRYEIVRGDHLWEVDVFEGNNQGLVVAEIELDEADELFEKPDWVAEEITNDDRYLNTNLAINPISNWGVK